MRDTVDGINEAAWEKAMSQSTFHLYWSPEGRKIATVQAATAKAAKRKAPLPYRRFPGEIYVVRIDVDD